MQSINVLNSKTKPILQEHILLNFPTVKQDIFASMIFSHFFATDNNGEFNIVANIEYFY